MELECARYIFRHRCMMRLVVWARCVSLILVLAPAAECAAQESVRSSLGPALLPLVGSGGFPRPPDIESGATDAGQLLVGVSLDLPVAPRLLLASTVAKGFQPFACTGSCAPAGSIASVALLWAVLLEDGKWGVLLGPSVERSTFDGTRTGGGATLSVGAVRGIGPRLTFRYHTLSGQRRPSSLAGFFAVRLGE
jgi:hypothetical protein